MSNVSILCEDNQILEVLRTLSSEFRIHHQFIKDETTYIVCDTDQLQKRWDVLKDVKKHLLYVLSREDDEANMRLVEKYSIHHLIGLNEGIYLQELIGNIKKTESKKLWGLKSYIEDESKIEVISLSDSKHTNETIEETLGHFDFKDYFSSPIEYIQVMANELISNSLYKGPNKKRLEQGLEKHDRKSPVFLKGSELVQVSIGMDTKGIALSVQDSFGGLTYDLLISTLKRSFEEKTPMEKKDGAGLGLYLTFLHSNQFIINLKKDFRTEVICIIDKNKRYKNYKQRIRSFHFFQEVTSEKIVDK